MTVFPFTPAGVEQKRLELYALSDRDLNLEADSIEADLTAWMRANFSLTTPQDSFLGGMHPRALKYNGQQCAICFRNRLMITLIYPVPTPGYTKWEVTSNAVVVKADGAGRMEVTGSLSFNMEYRP